VAYRLDNPDVETQALIVQAWLESLPRQVDSERNLEALRALWEDPSVIWYQGPGRSFVYLTDLTPGVAASLHALNLDGKISLRVKEVRNILTEAMREWSLHKLNALIPSPLVRVGSAVKALGFRHEGRIREVSLFNGIFTDVDFFGLLRSELEGQPPKKRRRRRRSRRPRPRKEK
jgi:hypothetical protein